MQAPRQSPECSHIGDSERSSRLNTSVASSFKSIQIDRTRTARRSGQNSTYNTPIRMRTRLKSHLSEDRSRYVIPRISVRRLLVRILVLLAVVLPVYRFSNPGAVRRHTGSVEPQSTNLWP